jgi:hypothetical protein
MMASSHPTLSVCVAKKETRKEMHEFIRVVAKELKDTEGDNMRALFLCRDKKALHRVLMSACQVWSMVVDEPVCANFYEQAKMVVEGDTNHVVHALLMIIFACPSVQSLFNQAPMAPYFIKVAKTFYDRHIMGLTEDGSFCSSAADRVSHGHIEYVMLMRQRYLSF